MKIIGKHTRGIWKAIPLMTDEKGNDNILISAGRFIAEVGANDEEQKANAKLIAESPALLNAIKLFLIAVKTEEIKVFPNSDDTTDYVQLLEDAVNKATF